MSVAGATRPNLVVQEPDFLSSCASAVPQDLVVTWQEVKLIGMGTEVCHRQLHCTFPLEF